MIRFVDTKVFNAEMEQLNHQEDICVPSYLRDVKYFNCIAIDCDKRDNFKIKCEYLCRKHKHILLDDMHFNVERGKLFEFGQVDQ